jgi:alpha/beta superfamily hydrolase
MVGMSAKVRELPVLLGRQSSLVGILTEASQAVLVEDAPVIVLLNAGIVHRVGPNRMYVLLARALAATGYTSLRFDHSGIGDSPNRVDALAPLESAMLDIREAVDWLASYKHARRFVVLGLCSGADHSLLYASSDRRVVGVALLDPSIPRTTRFHVNEFRRKCSSLVKKSPTEALDTVGQLLKRILLRQNNIEADETEPISPPVADRQLRTELEIQYRQCVLSCVKILAILTGGSPRKHNYREQLTDSLPSIAFGDQLTLGYVPQSDHSFTSQSSLEVLNQCVLRWLQTTSFANAGM